MPHPFALPNRTRSQHAGIVLLCSLVTQCMSHFVVYAGEQTVGAGNEAD